MADSGGDAALLEKIAKMERQIFTTCDLIPTTFWGFDEEIQEKVRQRKHKMVDQQLSKKEKKQLNNQQKGAMARNLGVSGGSVSEIFQWLSVSDSRPNIHLKTDTKLEKPQKHVEPKEAHPSPKSASKPVGKTEESSSDDDSDEEEGLKKVKQAEEKPKQAGKPVATVKPTVRADPEEMEEDDDSTDEESGPAEKKETKGGQKRKVAVEPATSAKKTKLDKELEKFDNVDPTTLDPIESRRVALLKLQKKLESFKQTRAGKNAPIGKKAADALVERKLKRRMSKMQLKQRRAEEKKKTTGGEKDAQKTVKKEEAAPILNDEGKVVFSKFDFIVKDPKKKRLSTSEKKDKFTGKDYRSLLHKAEKRNEKLAELKESDPEKAKEMEESIKWNRALKKAEGVKVKDNVELLKKGLRKKEKAKEKRLAKWDQRVGKVQSDKSKRQEKRETNISKRADEKKKKTMAKLRKKGRIL